MPFFFDREAEFQVHRRKLPHWTQSAVTYFVTFHLADSLPVHGNHIRRNRSTRWLMREARCGTGTRSIRLSEVPVNWLGSRSISATIRSRCL